MVADESVAGPPVPTMKWPPPRAGRVGWAWLLDLPWRRRRIRRMVGAVGDHLPISGTLVDVGGGLGTGAEEAGRIAPIGTYRRQIVVDPQWGMLQRGSHRGPRPRTIDYVRGDAARLPLPDGCADVALALGLLCCMTDEAVPRAIAELWRIVKPGGRLVVGVPKRRGDEDDPALTAQGFRRVRSLRPGRSIYAKPPAAAQGPLDPSSC